jgi:hypothetical protein
MRCRSFALFAMAGLAVACGEPSDEAGETNTTGGLCACRLVDGENECCFGHGECVEQDEGPAVCECDPGARGVTCSTPSPGMHSVRPRACEGGDPACDHGFEQVVVEAFDECVDLDGQVFDAVVVRPSDPTGQWPSGGPLPVAVLTHGASQDHADYYDLLEHIAANGIAVAAFDATPGGDVVYRTNRLLSFLECLRSDWYDADHLSDHYALIGHSRGGSAVAVAADAIAAGVAGEGVEVDAVVALAPAETALFALPSAATPAYLTIQGSRDPDIKGASLAWFDRAGEGDPGFVRSLAWIHGATHHRFHQGLLFAGTGELQASLDSEAHWTVARAYVAGFLRWRLLGHTSDRKFFTGEAVPGSVAAQAEVFAGLTDGSGGRLVVHDFSGNTLSPSMLGEVVTAGFDGTEIGQLDELDAPWSTGHDERGLRLDWSSADEAVMDLELSGTDVRNYSVLSVRLARTFEGADSCASATPVASLSLELDGARIELSELGESGRVEAPDRMIPETFGNWATPECHALDSLRPMRVPLQVFCDAGVDLSAVDSLVLRVAGESGGLLVDDITFELGEGEPAGCE